MTSSRALTGWQEQHAELQRTLSLDRSPQRAARPPSAKPVAPAGTRVIRRVVARLTAPHPARPVAWALGPDCRPGLSAWTRSGPASAPDWAQETANGASTGVTAGWRRCFARHPGPPRPERAPQQPAGHRRTRLDQERGPVGPGASRHRNGHDGAGNRRQDPGRRRGRRPPPRLASAGTMDVP